MITATRQIKSSLELPILQHYRCTAHVLNLIVRAAFEANVIPLSIKKLHIFINIIRNSSK